MKTTTTPRTTKPVQSKDKGKKVPAKTRNDRMLTHSHSTEYQVNKTTPTSHTPFITLLLFVYLFRWVNVCQLKRVEMVLLGL